MCKGQPAVFSVVLTISAVTLIESRFDATSVPADAPAGAGKVTGHG